jgi:hypothetical protein
LVAQIRGRNVPEQVVEAGKWIQQNRLLQGANWRRSDKQSWDPSVKALTQFPAVLANMNQNLA